MLTVDIYQTVPFPTMLAGYCVALTSSRRTTVTVGLALVPPVVFAIIFFGHDTSQLLSEIPKNLAFVAAPLLLGSAQRERRAAHAALLDRAETAERTRDEEARRRVGEERLRIARDVHDVVAHAMVAINVQAGVGAHLLDRDPERARRTLEDIKRASGEALADLRGTLGALRTPYDDATAPVAPTQGLAELDELGESLRSAGVDVDVDVDPGTATVPAAVAATGYRIVQEALTNVVRHAGGARARVRVARQADHVVIDVTDDGGGADVGLGPRRHRPRHPRDARARPGRRGHPRGGPARRRVAGAREPAGGRAVTIRVLLADDQTLVRAGFRALLDSEDDLEVVGEAVDGREAVALARSLRPGRGAHGHPDAAPRRPGRHRRRSPRTPRWPAPGSWC